jgi:catechol 2,3-dioxygenase-like lactoylglutathione lyase family enzyme
MITALDTIEVITLFVEDLKAARGFYRDLFGLETVYEDEVSSVMTFGSVMINLLQAAEAPKLVEPAPVAGPGAGARLVYTIAVQDADAVCAELEEHGVTLLNGPVDRPWGRRTAAFADPAGHVWEIAQVLE